MRIKGKAYLEGEVEETCIEFFRTIKSLRKECRPDLQYGQGYLIVPGSIDIHVHVRGAKLSYKEDVNSFSAEAAYGGVTIVMDMPNTSPYVNTKETVLSRLRELEASRVDFGVYSGVTESFEEVDALPIAGYKIFPEDLEKDETLKVLSSKKVKVLHPELPKSNSEDRRLRQLWEELAAIRQVRGERVHATHLTSMESISLAKSMGFTTDFTPHHLLVEGEKDCLTKVNPPIRGLSERLGLWKAFWEVDTIVSDHAPHSKDEKASPFSVCPPGIAGVSFVTPFVYSLVEKGILGLNDAVRLLSRRPAEILGINYGRIKEGYGANFTVLKLEEWRYCTRYSKVSQTPFDMWPMRVRVHSTYIEGKIAYEDGNIYPIRGVNVFDQIRRQGL